MKKRKKEERNTVECPLNPKVTGVSGEFYCKSLTPEQNEQVRQELINEHGGGDLEKAIQHILSLMNNTEKDIYEEVQS